MNSCSFTHYNVAAGWVGASFNPFMFWPNPGGHETYLKQKSCFKKTKNKKQQKNFFGLILNY